MFIAATYENGQIFQHFGHTQQFKIYEVKCGKIVSSRIVDNGGNGHESLTVYLKNLGVTKLVCGGVGGGAIHALGMMGIETYPGNSGDADEAVQKLLDGGLTSSTTPCCSGHGQGGCHGHQ